MPSTSHIFEDSDDEMSGATDNVLNMDASDSGDEGDDPRDLDYAPPDETPNHRNYKNEPRDPHLAARSAAAAKHPGRCAFTGEKNVCSTVQYAHGTARHIGYTRPDLMINLEYHWGFPTPYTLSLDSRNNIIPMNPTVHVANDEGGYGVLPQLKDLVKIYQDSKKIMKMPWKARKRYNILWSPPVEDRYWLYNPVMFRFQPDSEAPPITHRDPVPDANGIRPTTQHFCPYPNLQLVLRLHPVFAIVDLYLKVSRYKNQVSWTEPEKLRMSYVKLIMAIWENTPPVGWLKLRPQGFLGTAILPALGKATGANEEDNAEIDTPSRHAAGHITLPELVDGPLTAAETQAAIVDALAAQSKTAKGKGKAIANEFQIPPVAGPSNAHASTSGAVPNGEDGEAPAVTTQAKSGKKQASSKPRGRVGKRGREGDDEEEVDRPGKQLKGDVKGKAKGKQKASKSKQATEVEGAEGGPSKAKRSSKKAAQ
ncbi:hypothetical protein CPB85DRAFT_1298010 [Mucidula mucida]|nr:hypothetical protein CPB85DRAFT_1298010 [Mucidula mucida]